MGTGGVTMLHESKADETLKAVHRAIESTFLSVPTNDSFYAAELDLGRQITDKHFVGWLRRHSLDEIMLFMAACVAVVMLAVGAIMYHVGLSWADTWVSVWMLLLGMTATVRSVFWLFLPTVHTERSEDIRHSHEWRAVVDPKDDALLEQLSPKLAELRAFGQFWFSFRQTRKWKQLGIIPWRYSKGRCYAIVLNFEPKRGWYDKEEVLVKVGIVHD